MARGFELSANGFMTIRGSVLSAQTLGFLFVGVRCEIERCAGVATLLLHVAIIRDGGELNSP
ncbi:MAG TPA: hypothetical protein VIX20_07120, partial [Ktedonobacteraceae bacterium]